jgi:purine-binding chemotaxis protein CheW
MQTPRKPIAAIDWQKARERLSRAAAALDEAHQLSPERTQVILEKRARRKAGVPAQAPEAGAVIEVVLFMLGEERYALETNCVREILRVREITPLPGTPDFLVGITNLRGQILAVLDLRRFFDIKAQTATDRSRVIVLGQERIEFGFLADAVQEVVMLRIDEIREPPSSVAGIAHTYLRGVTAEALIVLDGKVLLNDARLFIDLGEDGGTTSVEEKS